MRIIQCSLNMLHLNNLQPLRLIIVSSSTNQYLSKRLLKLNVGFLLSEGPGNSRIIPINIPERVQVDDDLYIESLTGDMTLTRTKEGILSQAILQVMIQRECDRCLDAFVHKFDVPVEELFAFPADPDNSVFSIDSTGDIDLAPLLREEILIEEGHRVFCKEDCKGLSTENGVNLNHEDDTLEDLEDMSVTEAPIDPRLAILKQLLDD
jgi:uncharacterized protein